jgi:hypothetical protein
MVITQFTRGNLGSLGWNLFSLAIYVRVILPLIVLSIIVWALRSRKSADTPRAAAGAIVPLLTMPLAFAGGTLIGLDEQYRDWRSRTGSISYECGLTGFDTNVVGSELVLTEVRHLEKESSWAVKWPGKTPINAVGFPYDSRSYGGSQGIKWQEVDGQAMTALLSFSDVISEYGRNQIWVVLVYGDASARSNDLYGLKTMSLTCGADPSSYRPYSGILRTIGSEFF